MSKCTVLDTRACAAAGPVLVRPCVIMILHSIVGYVSHTIYAHERLNHLSWVSHPTSLSEYLLY
jgi:hypothetical protein